jgi:hypothetical protein
MPTALKYRLATAADAPAIAAVFSPSLRLLTFLPILHTEREDRRFIEDVILRQCEVTVAESDGLIVAFLARSGEEIRLLYTCPDFIGRGAGTLLIETANVRRAGSRTVVLRREPAGAPLLRVPGLLRGAVHERRS